MPADICLCARVRMCVYVLYFILQSGPLLLGNVTGLQQSVAKKEKSNKDITLSFFHSQSIFFYITDLYLSSVNLSFFFIPSMFTNFICGGQRSGDNLIFI